MIGLETDGPIEDMQARLAGKGVPITRPLERGTAGNFVHFTDPDGNEFYLWEVDRKVVPDSELQHAHA